MALGMNLDDIQLIYVMGKPEYNNLDEPTPWSNRPEVLKGLTITFLVCNHGKQNQPQPLSTMPPS